MASLLDVVAVAQAVLSVLEIKLVLSVAKTISNSAAVSAIELSAKDLSSTLLKPFLHLVLVSLLLLPKVFAATSPLLMNGKSAQPILLVVVA
jgi:hypothetical protein